MTSDDRETIELSRRTLAYLEEHILIMTEFLDQQTSMMAGSMPEHVEELRELIPIRQSLRRRLACFDAAAQRWEEALERCSPQEPF